MMINDTELIEVRLLPELDLGVNHCINVARQFHKVSAQAWKRMRYFRKVTSKHCELITGSVHNGYSSKDRGEIALRTFSRV